MNTKILLAQNFKFLGVYADTDDDPVDLVALFFMDRKQVVFTLGALEHCLCKAKELNSPETAVILARACRALRAARIDIASGTKTFSDFTSLTERFSCKNAPSFSINQPGLFTRTLFRLSSKRTERAVRRDHERASRVFLREQVPQHRIS